MGIDKQERVKLAPAEIRVYLEGKRVNRLRERYEREIQRRAQQTGDVSSGKVNQHKRRIAQNQHEHLRQDLQEKARKN